MTTAGIRSVSDVLATMREQELRGQEASEQELPYVAAEILMGGAPNARADVFTIGVLAYQMVTGKLPFKAASLPELMGQMLQAKPARAGDHRRRSSRAGQRGDPAGDRRDARQPFRVRRAVCALVAMTRFASSPITARTSMASAPSPSRWWSPITPSHCCCRAASLASTCSS